MILFTLLLACLVSLSAEAAKKGASQKAASKGKPDDAIETLRAAEQRLSLGYYSVIYSNWDPINTSDLELAQGQLLMNDNGAFIFEQIKKDPKRSYSVYFNPDKEFTISFPKLNTAYRASPQILAEPEAEPILAAYDGVRMLLGMSDVWSHPEKNTIKKALFGGKITLEDATRPYKWSFEFDSRQMGTPIQLMTCQHGFKHLVRIEKKTHSITVHSHTSEGTGKAFVGVGQQQPAHQWSITLGKSERAGELVFTQAEISEELAEKFRTALQGPKLDKTVKKQELTVALLRDWLRVR